LYNNTKAFSVQELKDNPFPVTL